MNSQGEAPILEEGENQVTFTCDVAEGVSARAKVTLITQGDPNFGMSGAASKAVTG